MTLKEVIDIYKNLVDTIIIQIENGNELEIPSEDAEFLDEELLERGISTITKLPSADYCIIYLD